MKLRTTLLLLPGLLSGCLLDSDPVSPAEEVAAFSLLGGLEAGESLTLEGEDAQRLFLAGPDGGAEYVVVPFFASDSGGARLDVEVEGEGIATVSGSPELALAPSRARESFADAARLGNSPGHLPRLERQREMVAPLLRRGLSRSPVLHSRLAQEAAAVRKGDQITVRVPNFDPGNTSICENPKLRSATVAEVTAHSILLVDDANPAGVSDAELSRIAEEYERLVHPVNARYFGDPTDIDGNGRVIILLTSVVNELTPPNSESFVAGFTILLDLLPRSMPEWDWECPASNEGEIFYLIAPDPEGTINQNPVSTEAVAQQSTSTIAHELQHLVNFGRRLWVNGAEELETTWLNEGLSHMAEELIFYQASGRQPGANLDVDDLRGSAELLRAFNRFQVNNLWNYGTYLEAVGTQSAMGDRGDDDLETRGATWAFLRYAADQDEGEDARFFHDLTNSRISGIRNLSRVLGRDARKVMHNWSVASYTDDLLRSSPPELQQPSWDYRSILPFFNVDRRFPLEARRLAEEGRVRVTLEAGSGAYLRVGVDAAGQARIVTTSGGAKPPRGLRVSVVRTR